MTSKPYRAEPSSGSKKEVYEVAEIRTMLESFPETPTGTRDRLTVMLLWCTGIKPRDLLDLSPEDLGDGSVRVREHEVVVPGGQREELSAMLEAWGKHRRQIADEESPLLCNLSGGVLDGSYLRHMFADLAVRTGISKRVHAGGFRNTFAAVMHQERVPLEIIRRQLCLSDLEYAAGYVDSVAPVGQYDAMQDFSLE